jgi:leucyl-tRNA synthetase
MLSEWYIVSMKSVLNNTLRTDTNTIDILANINKYALSCVEVWNEKQQIKTEIERDIHTHSYTRSIYLAP